MHYIDLEFRGVPGIIATAVLTGADGVTLVDPGPTSCLPALERGLGAGGIELADVRNILLTHIHLDHAGAAGTIVRRNPAIQVSVHERGARHMIDPSKLIDSASRLYGVDMDVLWGEMLPVPDSNVRVLRGGERLDIAGHSMEVLYTPGHASHHVTFMDLVSGTAFVGDTAGIRRGEYILPPTPPPDIDLEAWRDSLKRLLTRRPVEFFITHFGPWTDPDGHAAELLERLDEWSVRVLESLQREVGPGVDDASRAAAFAESVRAELRARLSPDEMLRYERAGRFDYSWQGLARYWRKRSASPNPQPPPPNPQPQK
jgi:glyoxylase-like metal-dependent hydrolase (beta-lactamase superfamily II)